MRKEPGANLRFDLVFIYSHGVYMDTTMPQRSCNFPVSLIGMKYMFHDVLRHQKLVKRSIFERLLLKVFAANTVYRVAKRDIRKELAQAHNPCIHAPS